MNIFAIEGDVETGEIECVDVMFGDSVSQQYPVQYLVEMK